MNSKKQTNTSSRSNPIEIIVAHIATNDFKNANLFKFTKHTNYKIELLNFFSNYYRVVIKLNFGFCYVRLFG